MFDFFKKKKPQASETASAPATQSISSEVTQNPGDVPESLAGIPPFPPMDPPFVEAGSPMNEFELYNQQNHIQEGIENLPADDNFVRVDSCSRPPEYGWESRKPQKAPGWIDPQEAPTIMPNRLRDSKVSAEDYFSGNYQKK